ncbi:MAG: tRNA glutamyl-Q(34) synthetase GluQRS [Luteolibacter sp.]
MTLKLQGLTRELDNKAVVTRFAPSPTGLMHMGHAYAAWVAQALAKQYPHGRFLLRFEDIDTTRVKAPYYDAIEEDLQWLGLPWDDSPLRQSTRSAAYQSALTELKSLGVVYPCFCTRGEIIAESARITNAPHGPDGPPYPGTCRSFHPDQREEKISSGLAHSWRLDSIAASQLCGPLEFTDLRYGVIRVDPSLLGDVILSRKDIGPAYHLAVVVDDAFQGITHVTRGEDLLHSTHVHRLLQALLKLPALDYLHHPLVTDPQGKRLAKRADSQSIASLRDAGMSPQEIFSQIEQALSSSRETIN